MSSESSVYALRMSERVVKRDKEIEMMLTKHHDTRR